MRAPLEAIGAEFAKEHPEVAVTVTGGASGNLVTQIENGAPLDLFFSADMGYPEKLRGTKAPAAPAMVGATAAGGA